MAILALGLLAAPAHAVKPYSQPRYKQAKAPLKGETTIDKQNRLTHRMKHPRSMALTRNGSAKEFQRKQWSCGSLGKR